MVHDAGNTTMNWEAAAQYCRNRNMRLPTRYELRDCLCPLEKGTAKFYWSGTLGSGSYYYGVLFNSCSVGSNNKTYSVYVKCVK
jgi:hypothetical protein